MPTKKTSSTTKKSLSKAKTGKTLPVSEAEPTVGTEASPTLGMAHASSEEVQVEVLNALEVVLRHVELPVRSTSLDEVAYWQDIEQRGNIMRCVARLNYGRMIASEVDEALEKRKFELDATGELGTKARIDAESEIKAPIYKAWATERLRLTGSDYRSVQTYEHRFRRVVAGVLDPNVLLAKMKLGWNEFTLATSEGRSAPAPRELEDGAPGRADVKAIQTFRARLSKDVKARPDLAQSLFDEMQAALLEGLRTIPDKAERLAQAKARRDAIASALDGLIYELEPRGQAPDLDVVLDEIAAAAEADHE